MKIAVLILSLLISNLSWGQRLEEKSLPWMSGQEVALDLKYAREIQIKTWDRDEVSVRVSVILNDNSANDAWSLSTETSADQILVNSDIEIPEGHYRGSCSGSNHYRDDHSFCSLIVYDIYVPAGAALRVETLGGNIITEGISSPIYAKSLSGFVDTDWPAREGATVTMKSITGEVYTNLDLEMDDANDEDRHRRSPVGWEIEATVAGGGSQVQLESVSNDIYFRKAGS